MAKKYINPVLRLFRCLLSVSIIAAGLSFIYGCLSIYYAEEHEYSRQIVADTFSRIAIPVYICLALVVISIIVNLFLPKGNEDNPKAMLSSKTRLELLLLRKDTEQCSCGELTPIKKERKLRTILTCLQAVLMVAASAVFLVYSLNGSNFTTDINASTIKAMWVLIPCLTVIFIVTLLAELFRDHSYKREIELVKALPSKKSTGSVLCAEDTPERWVTVTRCIILIAAVGILVYGLATGGVADVLTKAANICTECIGLG